MRHAWFLILFSLILKATAVDAASVSGTVRSPRGQAISLANVAGVGSAVTTTTDSQGNYQLDGVAGDLRIVPSKPAEPAPSLTSLDAVIALQASVGLRQLNSLEQLACDVNGSGALSALDAVLILQRVVGMPVQFPVAQACASDWAFVPAPSGDAGAVQPLPGPTTCEPGAITLSGLEASTTGQNFTGVVFGDCDGNWGGAVAPTAVASPTVSQTPTTVATNSPTPSATPSTTSTPTRTATVTTTPSHTASNTATYTASSTPSRTPTRSPSITRTPSRTGTRTFTPTTSPTGGASGPSIGGCSVFPANNAWNRDISADPVDVNSDAYVAAINEQGRLFLHADFGSPAEYGIPYVVVPNTQPSVPITFTLYGDESDPGPYPIPADAPVEGGSDRHVLVVQSGSCRLFEMYRSFKDSEGPGWSAGSGAIFDLGSNALRPAGWTSADAAGLPILPGLVRYDEVTAGAIHHALRFTVWRSQRGYVHPATHYAGVADTKYPPMGARFRLKAGYDISTFTGQSRVVLEALKRYGMFVADNGTSWYISGATDPRWNDEDLNQLKTVPSSAFEVVQLGTIHGP